MTDQEFAEIVQRLRVESERNPGAYRLRVAALAALGYGYVLMVVVGLLAAALAAIALAAMVRGGAWVVGKLVLALVALAFIAIRAMWVRLEPPTGEPLSRQQSPRLFELIEEARLALRVPRLHAVLAVPGFNAGVSQVPRLGLLGWHRSYLLIGLPLLEALSVEQFRAVLAHEFGHLSRNHGRFSGWIYRARGMWVRLLERLEAERHWGIGLFVGFLRWYAPRFNAYTFVLARASEYEADACSVELTSPRVAAAALVRTELAARMLGQSFWPGVLAGSAREPEPPRDVFQRLREALRAGLPRGDATQWLVEADRRTTGLADTHPALGDRLRAIELSVADVPEALETPAESAARLLGDALPALAARFSDLWRAAVRSQWEAERRDALERRARRDALRERASRVPLGPEEKLELAMHTLAFDGTKAGRTELEAVVTAHADLAPALFWLGRLRLVEGEEGGLEMLDRAMTLDRDAIVPACEVAEAFLTARGREAEAARFRERAAKEREEIARDEEERNALESGEDFDPHGLPDGRLVPVLDALGGRGDVVAAYLVRRRLAVRPDRPQWVLGVEPRTRFIERPTSARRRRALLSESLARDLPLPAGTILIVFHGDQGNSRESMRRVPGAKIL